MRWFNTPGSFIFYQRSRRIEIKPGDGSILQVPSSSIIGVGGEELNQEVPSSSIRGVGGEEINQEVP